MGSKRQKRNKKAAELAAEARQNQKKVWGARLSLGVVFVAVAAAYLKEDEVDISRITESRHCPQGQNKGISPRPDVRRAAGLPLCRPRLCGRWRVARHEVSDTFIKCARAAFYRVRRAVKR